MKILTFFKKMFRNLNFNGEGLKVLEVKKIKT